MTRKKIGLVIAFNLLLIIMAVAWYRHTPPLPVVCEGNLTFTQQRDGNTFTFDGEIMMRFHPDGTGYFTLNGNVQHIRQGWEVSRLETFNWRHMHDTLFEIAIINVERFSHDEIPDGVFEKYVAGLAPGQKRLLTIERTPEEAMVIGNFYSPLLICSE